MQLSKTATLVLCASLFIASGCSKAEPVKAEPAKAEPAKAEPVKLTTEQELNKAIDHIISLLDKNDFNTLFETYVVPKKVSEWKTTNSMEKVIEKFKERKAGELKKAMIKAKSSVPKFNEDKTTATFEGEPRSLEFMKIDGRWFIK